MEERDEERERVPVVTEGDIDRVIWAVIESGQPIEVTVSPSVEGA